MTQPQGFEEPQYPHFLCKLNKTIYRLIQAPRAWFDTLAKALLDMGFSKSRADSSLFLKITSQSTLYLLVYVDGIIIIGSNDLDVQSLISIFPQNISLKHLGLLNYFLGIEVTKLPNGDLFLNQSKCVHELLVKAHMQLSKVLLHLCLHVLLCQQKMVMSFLNPRIIEVL